MLTGGLAMLIYPPHGVARSKGNRKNASFGPWWILHFGLTPLTEHGDVANSREVKNC
jgi:hypothetical protein